MTTLRGTQSREHRLSATARTLLAIAIVAAIVVVVFVSGWADDKAPPGSQGRAKVTAPATAP
jgi:flagellar biosynthesis/type III secretory pathway M-ring protein FliF/YscJ